MAVFKPRTRLVSFRLSDDEYEHLRKASLSRGARSVSDYARAALCRLLESPPGSGDDGLEAKVLQLDEQMQQISLELHRLQQLIDRGAGQPAEPELVV
jgi:hypothetical protein